MGNYVNADPKALRSLANQIGYSGEAIRIECQHLKEAIDELRPTIDDETYRRIDSILASIHPAVESATNHARIMEGRINGYAHCLEIIRRG